MRRLPVGSALFLLLPLVFGFALPAIAAPSYPLPVREHAAPAVPAPFVLAQGFGRGAEVPFAADLDADGYADFALFARGNNGRVYTIQSERGMKAFATRRVLEGFMAKQSPVCVADLFGTKRPVFVAVHEGAIQIASRSADGSYAVRTLCVVPEGVTPTRLLAGDLDGDTFCDLVLVGAPRADSPEEAAALRIRSTGRGDVEVDPFPVAVPAGARLGDVTGDGRADLVWIRDRQVMAWTGDRTVLLARNVEGPLLAVGDVDGDARADLVVPGAWLLIKERELVRVADERLQGLTASSRLDLGNVDSDGRLDLVHFTFKGRHDVRVILSRPPGFYDGAPPLTRDTDHDGLSDLEEALWKTDPYVRDTDRDALLDGMEVKGFRGVRLPELGAHPLHRDIFLELDVEEGANAKRVRTAIKKMESLFANAPLDNPDGTQGIRIHCLVDTKTPTWTKGPSRQALREMYFTPERAGLFHWMALGAKGGGGQANLLSDHGACAGAYEATLPHEFGHQLGLRHGGDTSLNGIPIYPSLMNYAYNYQLEGDRKRIDFSQGHLAGLTLDENALSERVPLSADKIKFLQGPPFHFTIQALEVATPDAAESPDAPESAESPEGAAPAEPSPSAEVTAPATPATWVDWNRNGVFDSDPVRANINAASGEGYGPRVIIDNDVKPKKGDVATKSLKAPLLLTVGQTYAEPGTLALFFVQQDQDALYVRTLDDDNWKKISRPVLASDTDGLDLLTAYANGRRVHVFAKRGEGEAAEVVERHGHLTQLPFTGERTIDRSARPGFVEPAACFRDFAGGCVLEQDAYVFKNASQGAYLALRNPGTGEVWLRRREAGGERFGEGVVIEALRSQTPVSLAWDSGADQILVAFTAKQTRTVKGKKQVRPFRMRLARLDPTTLEVISVEWVGGENAADATSRRPALVVEHAPWLPVEGRVDIFHAGIVDAKKPNLHMYRSYTLGDRTWRGRGGWKEDMTWNEWSYSKDAPSAAWYRGRPFQVTRFYSHYKKPSQWNDLLALGPRADGVCDKNIRDTNDWDIIERYGLERSILQTHTPRGEASFPKPSK